MPLPRSAELFYNIPLTEEQRIYADSIFDNLVTFAQARAGSGKTTVAVGAAKIIGKPLHYIFPTVQEKALGYTTGDQQEKESKYLTPLLDALIAIGENPDKVLYSKKEFKPHAWVIAYSHNFLRGGNIKDSTVIIDEAQNLTWLELRTILTRIHDSCHVIICGDYRQTDINPKNSGFLPYLEHYRNEYYANVCELTKNFRGVISAHAETLERN
jgi:phosphate starvation-inducible PhoH-like protein